MPMTYGYDIIEIVRTSSNPDLAIANAARGERSNRREQQEKGATEESSRRREQQEQRSVIVICVLWVAVA